MGLEHEFYLISNTTDIIDFWIDCLVCPLLIEIL